MIVVLISGVFCAAAVGLTVAGFVKTSGDNPDGRILREAGKGYLRGGYMLFVIRRRILKKLQLEQREEQFCRAVRVNGNPRLWRLRRECTNGLILFGTLIALSGLTAGLAVSGAYADSKIETIERPKTGTEVYHLRARLGDENIEMDLPIKERTLTTEEVRELWQTAKETLPKQMLGDNPDADDVTERLAFVKKLPGTNIDLVWMSSDYKLIDYEGKVHPEEAEPEGSIVTVTVRLKYVDITEFLDIPVRVVRSLSGVDEKEQLVEELKKLDSDRVNDREWELPTDMGETPVAFYRKKDRTPWLSASLFLLFVVGLFAKWVSEDKRLRAEREDQMLRDYPELVSKITLLMQAGLTLRSAWDRITDDYLSSGQDGGPRYVYEEMRNARNKLNAGVPEETAYEEFGRNCGNIRYLRLSSVLVQNLKKGTGGLIPLLRKEAAEAFADRKERVKQRGEEAGTRLLLPMAGILVLILAIIMIPAFLSF